MKRRMEVSQHCWKFIYKHSDISIFALCHLFYFTNKFSSSGIYWYFNSSVRRVKNYRQKESSTSKFFCFVRHFDFLGWIWFKLKASRKLKVSFRIRLVYWWTPKRQSLTRNRKKKRFSYRANYVTHRRHFLSSSVIIDGITGVGYKKAPAGPCRRA